MSDPAAGLPAWIELRWAAPVVLSQVQLIFDTGMHRQLTLTQESSQTRGQQWGQPQSETVRDYSISCRLTASGLMSRR